jgi:hypothetical protein
VLNLYYQEINDYEKQKDSFQRIKDEDKLSKLLQSFSPPTIKFPEFGHINSDEHIKKYAMNSKSKIIKRFVRTPMSLESLPIDKFSVPDDVLTLLFAGVGIYTHSHPNIDQFYLNRVLDLASDGRLAYLIADSSICYGTNYPINRVFITNEFSKIHSTNTLFQLMGRAGRVGKSWIAEAYVTDEIAKRIIDYTRNKDDLEIENMNYVYEHILQDDIVQELMKKELENSKNVKVIKMSECSVDPSKIITNNAPYIKQETKKMSDYLVKEDKHEYKEEKRKVKDDKRDYRPNRFTESDQPKAYVIPRKRRP